MPEPIVFVSRNKIKPGMNDMFRQHYQNSLASIMAAKPNTLVQVAYENEAADEVTIVRLFPDANALDQQILGANERSKKAYELIEPLSIEIFGSPNPATLEMMKKIAGAGVVISISPGYMGGFLR